MFTSGTSPLTPLRASLWHFLVFAGVAWLAVAWTMLRLEPAEAVRVAGPVILFGAVSEALRALTGSSRWGLHTGLAVLFAATGAVLLVDEDASLATPAALIGWYLLVRGAADIALSTSARSTEKSWGVLMVLGIMQVALGFYAASAYAREPGTVVLLLAGLAVMRAVADLVTAMELRESPAARTARERAAGVAGYAAGLADYAAEATGRTGRPRHRAPGLLAGRAEPDDQPEENAEAVDLGAILALAGARDATAPGRAGEQPAPAGMPRAGTGATIDGGMLHGTSRFGEPVSPIKRGEMAAPAMMFTGPQEFEPALIAADLSAYGTPGHFDPGLPGLDRGDREQHGTDRGDLAQHNPEQYGRHSEPADALPGDAGPGAARDGHADPRDGSSVRSDASRSDASRSDASRSDASRPDPGRPDAGRLDAGRSDAGRSDAGRSDAGRSGSSRSRRANDEAEPSDGGARRSGLFRRRASSRRAS